ncbi:hypothetical protein C8250_001770 [Streptomyces sp. So13.3]|uniref:hypothetical protein n=1 Tax=Streptomyces TaxID=1883 RepID=UPI00110600EF|nr:MULTISPECIES: hypothetical protein [Streptomyces]MCZ4099348.1 hypothetical protein [Streptomyces sp. H39-C1]QNA70831.1 hypothetical protein C8250_001770 [Streptomyces sp. So13.3]
MTADAVALTRRSLHGIAELVLAGPQHREIGRIRLRIVGGGFGTIGEPALRVEGGDLVSGTARIALSGQTYAALAEAAGIEAGAPEGLYPDGSGVKPDEVITVDPEAGAEILRAFAAGDEALRGFAPETEPVLWPEHFDLAITLDEVNYGVSPGDDHLPEPYAYVGPHRPREGKFWNAPFGAARALRELGNADAIQGFFEEGKRRTDS